MARSPAAHRDNGVKRLGGWHATLSFDPVPLPDFEMKPERERGKKEKKKKHEALAESASQHDSFDDIPIRGAEWHAMVRTPIPGTVPGVAFQPLWAPRQHSHSFIPHLYLSLSPFPCLPSQSPAHPPTLSLSLPSLSFSLTRSLLFTFLPPLPLSLCFLTPPFPHSHNNTISRHTSPVSL